MRTHTVIRPEIDLAITRWSGHVTLEDMALSHKSYVSDPAYRVGRPHLYDLSEVVLPEIEQSGLEKYISMVSKQSFGPDGVNVTIFAPTDLLYGLARQYQALVESRSPIKIQIFRNEASAVANVGQTGRTIDDLMRMGRQTGGVAVGKP